MYSFFTATGRFAVRFRWLIVVAWVAAAVLATVFLPSLSSVTKQSTGSAPAGSPSMRAAQMATPFQGVNQTPVPVLIARDDGTLTGADTGAIGRLAGGLAKVPAVQRVKNLGASRDGQAAQLEVLASINPDTQGTALVDGIRHAIKASALPGDLHAHVAGPVAANADTSQASRTLALARACHSSSSWQCCSWSSGRSWPRC